MQQGWVVEGRYRVERRLGAGRAGEVWQAVDTVAEQPVAIRFAAGAEWARRFEEEVRALTQPPPTVVACHDSGTTTAPDGSSTRFLVIEYVPGWTLAEELDEMIGNFTPPNAGQLMVDVLRGLEHLHGAGLVHGGVRPSSIMLTDDPDRPAVLLDVDDPHPVADDELLHYLSPEQRGTGDVDARSDLYSVGRVLVAMLHHNDESRLAPRPYLAVIQRMSERDPARRPQDAAACIALLQDAMAPGRMP